MRNVYGLADMTIGHQFSCRMDQVHGYMNLPVVHVGFERLEGRILSDDATPLVVRLVLDLEVADPSMEVRYRDPLVVGRAGSGTVSIELGVDVPDAQHIGTPRRTAPQP
jgi:hypothetical protein